MLEKDVDVMHLKKPPGFCILAVEACHRAVQFLCVLMYFEYIKSQGL